MAEAIYCNTCGTQNRADARFCSHCGSSLAPVSSAADIGELPTIAITPAETSPSAPQGLIPGTTAYAPPPPVWTPPVRYAGFWIRVLAALIDTIILGAVLLPFSLLLRVLISAAGMAVSMPGQGVRAVHLAGAIGFDLFASWLYEALMESSSRQATLGKMVIGAKVTDLAGNRISFARASGRHFAKILSATIFYIGYIIVGFTERKQGLHDMIAGTLVVYKDRQGV